MTTKWTVPLLLLVALAAAALFVPEQAPTVTGGAIDSGDTAWLLTATWLVLLGVQPKLEEILRACALDKVFTMHRDDNEALASL